MSKKNFIVFLFLFSYTISLCHSAIPHGHFDDLFSNRHQQEEHHDADQNHNFPFSHCVTLHVAIEKQIVSTNHSSKTIIKKISLNNLYCSPDTYQPKLLYSSCLKYFSLYTQPASKVCRSSFSDRAPPAIV
jgi:hypothetical protein